MSAPTVTEVEEIQRLRAELAATQRRLQSVVEAAGEIVGLLEFALGDDARLLLMRGDAVADKLLGRACVSYVGQGLLDFLPGLRVTPLPAELAQVARYGGVVGPRAILGEGLLSGRNYQFFAFQSSLDRVAVKFWEGLGPAQSQRMAERSQQQLMAIFRHSPAAISLSRMADGVYVDVNDEWCRLTGYTFQQAMGRSATELGFWRHSEPSAHASAPLPGGELLRNQDIAFVRPDGMLRVLQLNGARIEIDDSPYYLSYLLDVTAQRQAQAALVASEGALKDSNELLGQQLELYQTIESLATVGHWTSLPGGAQLRWSSGLYAMAGLAPGSVQDTVAGRALILPEDLPVFETARAAMDGTTVEYRWQHPDGQIRWLRSRMRRHLRDGVAQFDYGVVQDITAERQASAALRDRLDFIQKVTSRLPGVVYQLRRKPDNTFEFLYISEPVRDIYRGVTPEDVLRNASFTAALHHPQDWPAFVRSLQESADQLAPWRHEYRLRFPDGSITWLAGQALPEREADGSVLWNGVTMDVTQRKQAEQSLLDSEARFRALTELSSDWYWEQDENFRFVRLEGSLLAANDPARRSSLGKTRWESGALNMTEADWQAHREQLAARQTFRELELQIQDSQGRKFWMAVSGEPIVDEQGVLRGYRGIGRNVTARKRAEEKVEQLAFYDVLTGLPNRRLLVDRLGRALSFCNRDGQAGALLFIDLDNFKDLNDTMGHDVGDLLLQQVAQRLSECVRETDTVSRLGGDEFVVLLEKLAQSPEEARAHAQGVGAKILLALAKPYALAGREHFSTPSIGVALFHGQPEGVDELLKQADLAMYQAKAAGRNTLRFFDPGMQAQAVGRAALESELRRGLQRNELRLYYQPVVDAAACVVGVEALVRWQHPQRGMVAPNDFIGMAEQTGLIVPLGQWVLEQACAQLLAWSAVAATARLSVAVNVSARQFRCASFATDLLTLLRVTGVNPYRLKLEITESLLLADMRDAVEKMAELRSIGVSFALDDFGTGYSSMSYLKTLPLEQLKIDRSFVRDVLSDPNDAAIAQAVLTLGHTLGLTVVAEGVETAQQYEFLRQHGCRFFQGYRFGHPVPIEQLDLSALARPAESVSWMI